MVIYISKNKIHLIFKDKKNHYIAKITKFVYNVTDTNIYKK